MGVQKRCSEAELLLWLPIIASVFFVLVDGLGYNHPVSNLVPVPYPEIYSLPALPNVAAFLGLFF